MNAPDLETGFREPSDWGTLHFPFLEYGKSVEGVPLRYLPAARHAELLVLASIHGEESETTFLLSRSLRMLGNVPAHVACILAANPDGVLRGTRCNARDVDLNRNFPTESWTGGKTLSRWVLESKRETALESGDFPASEPETRALVELIKKQQIKKIIALHSPIGVVDADMRTPLSQAMERVFGLPWQSGVGYPTPGSLGTFAREKGIECVTVELPREAPEVLAARYAAPFAEFLQNY